MMNWLKRRTLLLNSKKPFYYSIRFWEGRNFSLPLALTLGMVLCLVLLINVSFKVIAVKGLLFTASSILCPLVAAVYLLVLKNCNYAEQRQVLNQSLLALYLFSFLIFVLVHLPASPYMLDQSAYQIVFEDIPRKFFAATLAFGLSIYLPHCIFWNKAKSYVLQAHKQMLLAFFGGLSFFTLDFLLLFADPDFGEARLIYVGSFIIVLGLMFLACLLFKLAQKKGFSAKNVVKNKLFYTYYPYLVCFSVVVFLICQSCEYRLVSLGDYSLVASGIFFPLCIMVSNLIGEVYGWRANLQYTLIFILTELLFDGILIIIIFLPSPDFLNLNPFYSFIMPRRILATSLSLLIAFFANSFLLEELKKTAYGKHRAVRIVIANLIVNSVLCLVNYAILFSGLYAYDQIVNLVFNGWFYKCIVAVLSLPLLLRLYELLSQQQFHTEVFEDDTTINHRY